MKSIVAHFALILLATLAAKGQSNSAIRMQPWVDEIHVTNRVIHASTNPVQSLVYINTNKYPILHTLDGKDYEIVELQHVEPDGITVLHFVRGQLGGTRVLKIPFWNCPENVQKAFHYDPDAAKKYADEIYNDKLAVNDAKLKVVDAQIQQQQQEDAYQLELRKTQALEEQAREAKVAADAALIQALNPPQVNVQQDQSQTININRY